MRKCVFIAGIAVVLITMYASAQVPTMPGMSSFTGEAPRIIILFRDEVKPYLDTRYDKSLTAWSETAEKVQAPNLLAIKCANAPEVWTLFGFADYTAFDNMNKWWAQHPKESATLTTLGEELAPFVNRSSAFELRLIPELSLNAKFDVSRISYLHVARVQVRLGQQDSFRQYVRMWQDAARQSDTAFGVAAYRVLAGAQEGTYLLFSPAKTLDDLDKFNETTLQAMGEDGRKRQSDLFAQSVVSWENMWFFPSPSMSVVSSELAAANPDFWKRAVATVTAEKVKPVKPAAKKEREKN